MSTNLELRDIRKALAHEDKSLARQLLRPVLAHNPTADAWVLAAFASEDVQHAEACLKRALELDPLHTDGNRLLVMLHHNRPLDFASMMRVTRAREKRKAQMMERAPEIKTFKAAQGHTRATNWGAIITLMILLMGACTAGFALNATGVTSGFIGFITRLTGGPAPVTEIGGVRIQDLAYPITDVPVSASSAIGTTTFDLVDHGYVQEYTFERHLVPFMITVRFLAQDARDFRRNIAVISPQGFDVTETECGGYENELAEALPVGTPGEYLVCLPTQSGRWRVRVLGMEGVNVGAFWLTVLDIDEETTEMLNPAMFGLP